MPLRNARISGRSTENSRGSEPAPSVAARVELVPGAEGRGMRGKGDHQLTTSAATRRMDNTKESLEKRLEFLGDIRLEYAIGVLAVAAIVITELGSILDAMVPADVERVAWIRDGLGDGLTSARNLLAQWAAFSDNAPEVATPWFVATVQTIVDTFFLAALVITGHHALRSGSRIDKESKGGEVFGNDSTAKEGHEQNRNLLVRIGYLGLVFGAAFDLIENVSIFVILGSGHELVSGAAATAAAVAFLAAWGKFLLLLALPPIAYYGTRIAWSTLTSDSAKHAWVMTRVQLVAVVVAALLAFLPLQLHDIYLDLGTSQTIWLIVLVVCGSLLMGATSRILIDGDIHRQRPSKRHAEGGLTWWQAWLAVAAVLAAFGAALRLPGLLSLAGVAAVLLVLSAAMGGTTPPSKLNDPEASTLAPAILAIAPPVLLGVGALRFTSWFAVYSHPTLDGTSQWGAALKPVLGAALVITGVVALAQVIRHDTTQQPRNPLLRGLSWLRNRNGNYTTRQAWSIALLLVGLLAPAIFVVARIAASPASAVAFAPTVGPIGIAVAGAIVVVGVGTALVLFLDWFADRYGVPNVFRVLGFWRIPLVSMLGVWMIANTFMPGSDNYYDIRTVVGAPSINRIDHHLDGWLIANSPKHCHVADGRRCAVPLLLIAAEGGGIRAGAWTAGVMDRTLSDSAPLVLSGTSGGSVGFAAYEATKRAESGTAFDRLTDDYLSATLGWALFRDLPAGLLGTNAENPVDRSEIHELAFEAAWTGGELATRISRVSGKDGRPVLIFNSASVVDSCLINAGTLDNAAAPEGTSTCGSAERDGPPLIRVPASVDVLDLLCNGQDLPLSSAAILSSRFPFISPAGRLTCDKRADAPEVLAVDGGYVDNTGASPLIAIWPHLTDRINEHNRTEGWCVVPIMVQIDNGGESLDLSGDRGNVSQVVAPLRAFFNAGNASRDTRIKAIARDMFTDASALGLDPEIEFWDPEDGDVAHYLRIFPVAEPGRDASLGWQVSSASRELFVKQLENATAEPMDGATLIDYLTGQMTCSGL